MRRIARTVSIAFILFAAGVCPPCAHAEALKIGGTGAGLTTMSLLADAYVKTHADIAISVLPSLGSSGGIKAVAAGAIQLAVSSRDLTEAERKQGLVAVEYGRTPFVFAVSVKNKVEAITLQQLADIYSGKTVQWPDGVKIRIVLRPPSDADSEMVRSMSPELEKAKKQAESRPGMLFAVIDQDTQENIERIPGALGATSLGQIMAEQRQIKALTLDGVRPSPQNLANGSYAYAKIMFLVTSSKTPAAALRFAEFVRSAAGREILGRSGYWVR
jgi:phosphate transport system substrate-binding protein